MSVVLAAWLNDLDPVAIHFTDWLEIRWYGIAYVAGFLFAYLFMKAMVRRGLGVLNETQLADFVTYTALFGVMLGGRLGYLLLYDRAHFFSNPLIFFQITKGGMASHGGIFGIVAFTWIYSRLKNVSWTGLGDMLVVPAPIGIFFGRLANFINGELWGHEARGLSWAVQFPQEAAGPGAPPLLQQGVLEHLDVNSEVSPDKLFLQIIHRLRDGDESLRALLVAGLPERHPSPLYAALLEGALLFAILCFVRLHWRHLPHGVLTGLFFIGYAIFRIIGEQWRVPDSEGVGWLSDRLTPGQQYSLPMILVGVAFLWHALRSRRSAARA